MLPPPLTPRKRGTSFLLARTTAIGEDRNLLEALGLDGAVAFMREHAAAERPEAMNKVSRFRGVTKEKRRKTKPWSAQIRVTEFAMCSDNLTWPRSAG